MILFGVIARRLSGVVAISMNCEIASSPYGLIAMTNFFIFVVISNHSLNSGCRIKSGMTELV
jgi:hypothetical protein